MVGVVEVLEVLEVFVRSIRGIRAIRGIRGMMELGYHEQPHSIPIQRKRPSTSNSVVTLLRATCTALYLLMEVDLAHSRTRHKIGGMLPCERRRGRKGGRGGGWVFVGG